MPSPARNSEEGVEARKVALRMLDAVLRRGQTMDNAAQAARGLPPADAALASAERLLLEKGVVKRGDLIVLTVGEPMGQAGGTNTLKIVRVGEHA